MRIAFVAPGHPYRGGIAHFATRLAQEMNRTDEVMLVNFSRLYPNFLFPGKTQFDESASSINFPSDRLIDSINPLSWRKAAAHISNWRADVTVFHFWHPFFSPAYSQIANRVKVPCLAICHNVVPHDAGRVQRELTKVAFRAMSGFMVHAKQEEHELLGMFPQATVECAFHPLYDVFPNSTLPKSEARALLGLKPEEKVVLYFGLIRPYKGVDVLLEAASHLGDVSNLRIMVVGEVYGDRSYLDQAITKTPAGMVTLIDKYVANEEVAQYFRAADIIALPYRNATQSGVIPIAYACDRPVIATRVGGLPDAILEGESGYLISPESSGDLATAIRNFFVKFGSPSLESGISRMRDKLGWAGYAEILKRLITRAEHHAH